MHREENRKVDSLNAVISELGGHKGKEAIAEELEVLRKRLCAIGCPGSSVSRAAM
jgi:hypothetical protein